MHCFNLESKTTPGWYFTVLGFQATHLRQPPNPLQYLSHPLALQLSLLHLLLEHFNYPFTLAFVIQLPQLLAA